jgi:hypothetical protein
MGESDLAATRAKTTPANRLGTSKSTAIFNPLVTTPSTSDIDDVQRLVHLDAVLSAKSLG